MQGEEDSNAISEANNGNSGMGLSGASGKDKGACKKVAEGTGDSGNKAQYDCGYGSQS